MSITAGATPRDDARLGVSLASGLHPRSMASTAQDDTPPDVSGRDEQLLLNENDDEVALSPASRKVLESCSMEVASVQDNEARPLISRPTSSGVDMTGFQFSKPAHPLRKLATGSKPSRPGAEPFRGSRNGVSETGNDGLQAGGHPTKKG